MNIFAFGHKKQVGKDTFVKFVIEILRKKNQKLNIQRVGFADKLKATCHMLYGWAGHKSPSYYEHTEGSKNEKLILLGKTVRELWIEFGNHARTFDENIWINPLLKSETCDVLFITDLRYPNETKSVKAAGGTIVKIENDNVPTTDDVADCALDGFKDWNQIIKNNGTLNELYKQAEEWVDKLELTSMRM